MARTRVDGLWVKNAAGVYVQAEPVGTSIMSGATTGDVLCVASDDTVEAKTITAGTDITITHGAGTITIASTASGGGGGATVLYDSGHLASATNSIDTGVGGIAGGYNILEIWILARVTATNANLNITFNNDTGSNYHRQFIRGVNTTASAATGSSEAAIFVSGTVGGTHAANNFGVVRMTVPFYESNVAYKIVEYTAGNADSAGATNRRAEVQIAVWANTAAITRMAVSANSGLTLVAGSRLVVFGR